jgi:predicted  nucleic acid-binding Zn-ribbon protein
MNKSTLQEIANRLQVAIKSSKPNTKYSQLVRLIEELNNSINQLEDVVEVVEEKTTKKKKSTKKKKTSTED